MRQIHSQPWAGEINYLYLGFWLRTSCLPALGPPPKTSVKKTDFPSPGREHIITGGITDYAAKAASQNNLVVLVEVNLFLSIGNMNVKIT